MVKPTRNRLRIVIRLASWIILIQFVLLNISAAFYAHRLTHFYDPADLPERPPSNNIFARTWRIFTGPRISKSPITETLPFSFDTIEWKTRNGITIEAWHARADSAKGTVILFHGITSNKSHLQPQASEFYFMGYDVMLVDLRAHGNSGGNNCSVGVRESEEVKLAYDHAQALVKGKIFLYGMSLGAVVVAKAVSDHDLRPAGIILDMPFGSLHDHMQGRARTVGFPEEPFAFLVTFWTGLERGYNGFSHRTPRYAAQVNCPVLIQCGNADEFVLKDEIEKIFHAIPHAKKKMVEYENAGHGMLLFSDPVKWKTELAGFLSLD